VPPLKLRAGSVEMMSCGIKHNAPCCSHASHDLIVTPIPLQSALKSAIWSAAVRLREFGCVFRSWLDGRKPFDIRNIYVTPLYPHFELVRWELRW